MSFLVKRSLDEHKQFINEVSDLCERLSNRSPITTLLNSYVKMGDYKKVIEYEFDYNTSTSYGDLLYGRQIQALLNKQSFLDLGYDPKKQALDAFILTEEMCRETNERLSEDSPNGDLSVVSHYAISKISSVLGVLPSNDAFDFSFGPGANTNVRSADASYKSKLSASLTCSLELIPHAGEFLEELPLLVAHHGLGSILERGSTIVPVVPSAGKLQFVPKTSRTHRPIVVEPLLNGLLQKGVGAYIRNRLLASGIDLRDQSRNQRLAWEGSVKGNFATIDLSSASDTISVSTVFELLPFPWASFLGRLRTGTVVCGEQTFHLEKFSSMGNGFTFELESLIFFGLAYGVLQYLNLNVSDLSIYGDDIIIPAEAVSLMTKTLNHYGFSVNTKKSFWSGPFRESCGADFYHGLDIRPFYLREKISDEVLYTFHNWAVRNCERELANLIQEWTIAPNRLFGPDGYGDGHLIGTYQLRQNRKLRRDQWCGGYFDTYSRKKVVKKRLLPGDWIIPAYSVYTRSGERDPTDPDVVRGSKGYAKVSIYSLATSIFRRY